MGTCCGAREEKIALAEARSEERKQQYKQSEKTHVTDGANEKQKQDLNSSARIEAHTVLDIRLAKQAHIPIQLNSELAKSLEYTAAFLEQNSELEVISQSYPREELKMFMSNLETLLNLIKDKTGFAFAPSTLQPSLIGPQADFMVTFHRVSQID